MVPHITDAIQEWVEKVAKQSVTVDGQMPDVCIIELGGTIGDIEGMPFVEAFRQFQFRVKKENFCSAHVSLVPSPKATGEQKTKPTQSSVRELRGLGISPDLIICRSEKPIGDSVKDKISNFCHVAPEQVITIHDLSSIYRVPLLMKNQGIIEYLNERLQLNIQMPLPLDFMRSWENLAERIDHLRKRKSYLKYYKTRNFSITYFKTYKIKITSIYVFLSAVNIALVGKYTKLEDAYASVIKALQHASFKADVKLKLELVDAVHLEAQNKITNPVAFHEAWKVLCSADGVIVPGGFGDRGINGKISASKWCRENNKPFLGICLGLQTAVIEFATNVLQLNDANSTEFSPECQNPVVIDMPEHNNGDMGGTMRLGKRATCFSDPNSLLRKLYGDVEVIEERHRHRYEVNKKYVPEMEKCGLKFVAHDGKNIRMEIIELENHDYYVATQFHPEYLTRPLKPSPPFLGLILASIGKLNSYIAKECRLSPPFSDNDSDETSSVDGHNSILNGNVKASISPAVN